MKTYLFLLVTQMYSLRRKETVLTQREMNSFNNREEKRREEKRGQEKEKEVTRKEGDREKRNSKTEVKGKGGWGGKRKTER